MRRPRPRITVDWVDITKRDVLSLAVMIAIGLVFANGLSKGSSVFGFESSFWDLGLIPILSALVIGICRVGGTDAARRRFLLGFEIFGLAATTTYVVSLSRGARWSLVSAVLPFQTGMTLAPGVGTGWKNLVFWHFLVDAAILASLPLIVATLGGVILSVRSTVRRVAVAVAVIAVVLGALVGVSRRVRRFDDLATYHRNQISAKVYSVIGPDGMMMLVPASSDQNGTPLTLDQRKIDRWHAQMATKYSLAARRPWLDVALDLPPHD